MAASSEVKTFAAADLLKVALESKAVTLSSGSAVEQAEELGDAFKALYSKMVEAQTS